MSKNKNRRGIILNVSEIDKIDFNEVWENSSADLQHKSLDGTLCYVQWWDNDTPDFVGLLTTGDGPHNHSKLEDIFESDEWKVGGIPHYYDEDIFTG